MPHKDPEQRRSYYHARHEAHREERNAYTRTWHEAHLEECRVSSRAWREAHKEELTAFEAARRGARLEEYKTYDMTHRAERKAYRGAHQEERRAYNRAYQAVHHQQGAEHTRRHRALLRGAAIGLIDLEAIKVRDRMICAICGKRVAKKDLSFDHSHPLSLGGTHSQDNLRVSHWLCNSKRGAGRLPVQMVLV